MRTLRFQMNYMWKAMQTFELRDEVAWRRENEDLLNTLKMSKLIENANARFPISKNMVFWSGHIGMTVKRVSKLKNS